MQMQCQELTLLPAVLDQVDPSPDKYLVLEDDAALPRLVVHGDGSRSRSDEYVELLRSIHELHFQMTDLNQIIQAQSESIVSAREAIEETSCHITKTEQTVVAIKTEMDATKRWGYFDFIRTQVIPIVMAVGVQGPLMYAVGAKTGLLSVPLTYSLVQWMMR